MALPSQIVTGKKSNNAITFAEETNFNQVLEDDAVGVIIDGSPGARVTLSDQGAIRAGENIAQGAFDLVDSAVRGSFETLGEVLDKVTQQSGAVARGGFETANIRSQLPAETIAQNDGGILRIGMLAAAAVAVAFFAFQKGG
ncbi:MAG: hypothetical protein ACX939_10200 [Hyphococcus sp.]